MSKLDEEEILQEILEGDDRVLGYFYRHNVHKIEQCITKNLHNKEDAQDIFQDAFMIIYQKLKENSLQLQCSISTYIFAICKNLWMNSLRKSKRIILREEILDVSKAESTSII